MVLGPFALIVLLLVMGPSFGYECDKSATVCRTSLVIEDRITMMHKVHRKVYPHMGKLYRFDVDYPDNATEIPLEGVITGDGYEVGRLVVVANNSMPGPPIIVYVGQRLIIDVTNKLPSDTVTLHWHGLPQHKTPWMDGVPFITQCPILSGQTFTYDFIAEPKGTFWYHAHTGSMRSNGLNGAFVIKEPSSTISEHIMVVQGFNHNRSSDLDFKKMQMGHFEKRQQMPTTESVDGGFFSRFFLTSALINGKGRYYPNLTKDDHNFAPLTMYNVQFGNTYRFRVVNAGALYPMRIAIDNHSLTLTASDGFDFKPVVAESFIINPGERYDFFIVAEQPIANYWVRAETIEYPNPHKAKAILRYSGAGDEEPTSSRKICTPTDRCLVVNCPFTNFPAGTFTDCMLFAQLRSLFDNDPAPVPTGNEALVEHFLNFAFPGIDNFPSSVNGRQFKFPKVSALTQPFEIDTSCDDQDCGSEKLCQCSHSLTLHHNDVVQFVILNMGVGTGWSHPIHLHGYSFYVLKMGYATYNETSAKFIAPNPDIDCRGHFCNDATWSDPSWLGDNVPGLELSYPTRKDTLIIPSGGYAVIRVKADNPGVWLMHCHIELHANDGMMMYINNSYEMHPPPPDGFPICHNFPSEYRARKHATNDRDMTTSSPVTKIVTQIEEVEVVADDGDGMKAFWIGIAVMSVVCLLLFAYILHLCKMVKVLEEWKKSAVETKGVDNPSFSKL
ncbi:laccase-1-like [Mizuhopecten yessoensis]|uniref:Laccase-2 n=1 Tax=Mizuhopecten yessoensis TaxID=6573 RepID=A0A210QHL2_MIZYE|nr:laccase-1-like [Mizuhopecten yessoensis]XP_021357920.1 laccase-1-like [Mizuhopecten yessoensis]XP_021357921.1 laccase-1-like [Mizuhopecten yessoensis]OWF48227.1 Laccase-2 [Mizuhopecten yessoensis]